MSIQALTKVIRHLLPRDQVRLFDHLQPSIEDYLLAKIANDRFAKTSKKRICWEKLKA